MNCMKNALWLQDCSDNNVALIGGFEQLTFVAIQHRSRKAQY